jgi:endo-1,3(4)-beta-glucanase
MGRLDPTFIEELGGAVDAIFYDVANSANLNSHDGATGAFFPVARHKAWFDGHSFASGLFPFGNGKSQESSSEAVNCYYGAYLWSAVRHGSASQPSSDFSMQTDFARLLLAMEVRGAKTYWHMLPRGVQSNQTTRPTVYSQGFAKNYMVGNLGMLDAVCSTWFRTETLYVHMINFMPVTSITGELFNRDYVSVEYSKVFGPPTEVEMAWRGYVVADHAIVDPNAAWEEAQSLFSPQLDSAVSKSQILYWIATRSGFNVSKLHLPTPRGPMPDSSSGSLSPASSCEDNKGCASAGLTGECCP